MPRLLPLLLAVLLLSSVSHAAEAPVVVFDTAHGERFSAEGSGPLDLSAFAQQLAAAGIAVSSTDVTFTDASLTADAVIISGAFGRLTTVEIDALDRYLQRGGKLAVILHIAPPLTPLLHRLGVAATTGVIRERENVIGGNEQDFRVVVTEGNPLVAGVGSFGAYGAWGLAGFDPGVTVVASTSPSAWIDRDGDRKRTARDAVQEFAVIVEGSRGKGKFVVVGDDAIFQNKFLTDGNLTLAKNLAAWMKR